MKKTVAGWMMATVCALACIFCLSACDDGGKKHHTEDQWAKILETAESEKDYCWRVSQRTVKGTEVDPESNELLSYFTCNGSNELYAYSVGEMHQNLYKKNGRYYENKTGDGSNAYELQKGTFDTQVAQCKAANQPILIDCLKPHYADMDFGTGLDGEVETYLYHADQLEVTMTAGGKTETGTLYNVCVEIKKDDDTLWKIYAEAATADPKVRKSYEYTAGAEFGDGFGGFPVPKYLAGKTATLTSILAADTETLSVPDETYSGWCASVVTANEGKTVTANADGTLTSDIVIDMEGGESLALNTLRYTEDFSRTADPWGKIVVSNAHISGLEAGQQVTLTGEGFQTTDNLELAQVQGAVTFIYIFTLQN